MIWDELPGDLTEAHHFALEELINEISAECEGSDAPVIAEIGRHNPQVTVAVAQICSEIEKSARPEFLSFNETFDHGMAETIRDQGFEEYIRFFNHDVEEAADDVEDGSFNLIIINAKTAAQVERLLWDWTQKLVVGGRVVGVYDDYSILAVKKVTKGDYTRIGDDGCLWLISAFTR